MENQVIDEIWNERVFNRGGVVGGIISTTLTIVPTIIVGIVSKGDFLSILGAFIGIGSLGCALGACVGIPISTDESKMNLTDRLSRAPVGSRKRKRLQKALDRIKNTPDFKAKMAVHISSKAGALKPQGGNLEEQNATKDDNISQQQIATRVLLKDCGENVFQLKGVESLKEGIDFQI